MPRRFLHVHNGDATRLGLERSTVPGTASIDRGRATFSLICIGAFPAVPNFTGLGQLTPDQLASLLDSRHPVSDDEVELGSRAWVRFCAPDPARPRGRWRSGQACGRLQICSR